MDTFFGFFFVTFAVTLFLWRIILWGLSYIRKRARPNAHAFKVWPLITEHLPEIPADNNIHYWFFPDPCAREKEKTPDYHHPNPQD